MGRKVASSGPPAWLVFLIAVSLIFGGYYLWVGFSSYLRTGGLGVVEATERANIVATATAVDRILSSGSGITQQASATPVPECQPFVVSVPSAIVRDAPNPNAAIVNSLSQGTEVCVLEKPQNSEWYTLDENPRTRRVEFIYMHETVIEAVNPTLTPSRTTTALPTVTDAPTNTPTLSPTPAPTATLDPDATDTPTPTSTSTVTPSFQSA